jgi:hypothetical protein
MNVHLYLLTYVRTYVLWIHIHTHACETYMRMYVCTHMRLYTWVFWLWFHAPKLPFVAFSHSIHLSCYCLFCKSCSFLALSVQTCVPTCVCRLHESISCLYVRNWSSTLFSLGCNVMCLSQVSWCVSPVLVLFWLPWKFTWSLTIPCTLAVLVCFLTDWCLCGFLCLFKYVGMCVRAHMCKDCSCILQDSMCMHVHTYVHMCVCVHACICGFVDYLRLVNCTNLRV